MSNVVTREERLVVADAARRRELGVGEAGEAVGGRVVACGAASEILGELEAVS
jgi:hypothetical protein